MPSRITFKFFRSFSRGLFTMKADGKLCIGTHDGNFHCDEVLAISMLKNLPEYADAKIIRSRNMAILDTCDIVVDVGAIYDPSRHRYDHHQKSFTETMSSLNPDFRWTTRLSSAGLVYYHFGKRILSQILNCQEEPKMTHLYKKVYENFVEEIDAIDNGIATHDGPSRYRITTTLSSRVGGLNPNWLESGKVSIEERFEKALQLVGSEFMNKVSYFAEVWYPAKINVENAVNNRFNVDPSGAIIEFPSGGVPWKEHLFTIEEEKGIENTIQFAVFPDDNGGWRVCGVPVAVGSFELRTPLRAEWRGIRDQELSNLLGIEGAIFVHANGFIGGHKTREGALVMAKLSLNKS
ncbi:MYG1 exonuclease-like isoform X2 [Artemia franciscana]|uniref:Uncharacterized protein n=1 Tax=Artemia franciscana TaxID=6661 RepID=A0AA88H2V9_ARTSF|nr:hypothetical protein QYM36_018215 [Artemia franciscana]